jgi:hypothetical protein
LDAQVLTVNNPNLGATVSNDQVISWGQSGKVKEGVIFLNFEGLGNLDEVGQFYSGGTSKSGLAGHNYGVNFTGKPLSIIDSKHGGTGNFTNPVLPNTVLFFMTGPEIVISAASGFSGGVSFYYSASEPGEVMVFDGPGGTGVMLASMPYQALSLGSAGDLTGYFDTWKLFKLLFSGTAKSVIIKGTANKCAFDDIVLGKESGGKSKGTGAGAASGGNSAGSGNTLFTARSQTEKGKLFLAGSSSLQMDFGSSKSKHDGDTEEGSEYNYFDLNFLPKAGYFFIPNFVGGMFIDLETYSNKSKDSGYGYKGTTFIIGPFGRYYVPVTDEFMPFAELQFGGGVDNYKSRGSSSDDWTTSKETVFTYRIGGGATYFFNNIVGCDLFLGYQHDAYKYKDSGDSGSSSKSIYSQFTVQLGIVVVLDM